MSSIFTKLANTSSIPKKVKLIAEEIKKTKRSLEINSKNFLKLEEEILRNLESNKLSKVSKLLEKRMELKMQIANEQDLIPRVIMVLESFLPLVGLNKVSDIISVDAVSSEIKQKLSMEEEQRRRDRAKKLLSSLELDNSKSEHRNILSFLEEKVEDEKEKKVEETTFTDDEQKLAQLLKGLDRLEEKIKHLD